jgi:hypothetical protein
MFFDRNFVIGYMLPAVGFWVVTLGVMNGLDLIPTIFLLTEVRILLGIFVIGIASWVGGECLFIANQYIVRLMEGYGKYNPFGLLAWRQRKRFAKLHTEISDLDKK